ncbi:MAG: hypothetical protein QOI80_426, partial [Solirubrobacteraceae bacterium]|nr:hypothetical protein [Solirubrobacteraceae bacterium]
MRLPSGLMARSSSARAPWALLCAIAAAVLYACFARGAVEEPSASWLELMVAIMATAGVAAWLYGNGLALATSRLGVLGIAALVLFAAWAAASIAYSVTPDRSWGQANTVVAYALTVGIGLLIGSSLPRAAERVGLAIGAVAVVVALYAFAAKATPGILGLDTNAGLSRLRTPLGYWNALALVCVTGALPLLRTAADPHQRPWPRVAALLGSLLLLTVLGMTYSRGGFLALAAGAIALIALSTERVRTLVLLLSTAVATAPPLTVALGRSDLADSFVPLQQRTDDGVALLLAFLFAAVLLAAWARALIALETGGTFTPARGRAWGRPAAAVAAAVLAVAAVVFVVSGGAGRAFDRFKETGKPAALTDPSRLLSRTSGNRWVWWKEAAGAFSDRPVAGWGAGSSPVTHLLYRKDTLSVQQPHSVPLEWLAESGIVGFALALAALVALLGAGLERVRALPWAAAGSAPERGAAAALFAVAVAWLAQAVFEWSWDIPAVTLPMFLALGVLAARPAAAPAPLPARGPALTAVAIGFVLFAVSAGLPAVARTQVTSALAIAGQDAVSPGRLRAAAAKTELAARLNPLATDPLLAAAKIAKRRGRNADATRALLRALERQPDA